MQRTATLHSTCLLIYFSVYLVVSKHWLNIDLFDIEMYLKERSCHYNTRLRKYIFSCDLFKECFKQNFSLVKYVFLDIVIVFLSFGSCPY